MYHNWYFKVIYAQTAMLYTLWNFRSQDIQLHRLCVARLVTRFQLLDHPAVVT